MSLTYPIEIESCAVANTTESFAQEFGFADANMIQSTIIACTSVALSLGCCCCCCCCCCGPRACEHSVRA